MPTGHPEFVDSNILVYEWDERDPDRQRRARRLIAQRREKLIVSTQVLQEVAVTLHRKLHIPWGDVREVIKLYSRLKVAPIDSRLIQEAIDTAGLSQLSFWDALIVQVASDTGCRILYSEDLNADQSIRGVRIINPFS